ncbi:conserved phage C-terminal domain-containing protein [Sodalis sp. RH24]|uniref:conserved phage C-terminal domain-containing protein n=1 Tax=unclassified Sodalis (in: enterobacteria) TaxID=2636512 RepID=UPI0039B4B646
MSVKLSSWVWDGCANAGIRGAKLMIMARLADFSSDEGICWPGVETIARQIGAGRSTVITAIGELEKAGWLSKQERRRKGNRNETNVYRLNVAKLRSAAAAADSHRPDSEHSDSERSKSEGSNPERSDLGEKPGFDGPESGPDPSLRSTPDPSDIKPPCQPPVAPDPEIEITDHAKQVLAHLNRTTGSKYQTSKSSLDNIRARLREDFTMADLMLVVDYSVEKWGEDLKMTDYLRPSTLFQPTKFPGYLQSATKWETAGRPPRAEWGKKASAGDNAEREAAYKRYFRLTLDNKSKSDIETAARKEADGASVKAMRADFAKITWNKIWAECSQRLNGGKAA